MTRIRLIILSVLSMVFVSMRAQTENWSLQRCVSLALNNSLYMKNEQIAVGKAKDLQGTAFDMEKTSISLSQDPTSGGSPDNGITISQTFDFPTVYSARNKLLKAETAVAQSQVAIVGNQLVRDVTSAYYSWLHAHSTLLVLQKQDSVYQHFLQLTSAKYKSGEANQLEQMNAQRLLNENRISLQRAENDCKKYMLQLKQLINTNIDFTPQNEGLAKLHDANLGETNFSDTPLGRNMQARLISKERSVSLAKQGYMPSFTLGFTTQAVIKGFNPYNVDRSRFSKGNFMGFEVGIGIPLFWKSIRSKVKAAKRDVELVQNERALAEQQQKTLMRDATNEYLRAKQVLDYYETRGNAEATLMAHLSQINYENGEMGYVEYIQNQTSALDVQLRYIDAVNDYNQTIININYLNGNKQ